MNRAKLRASGGYTFIELLIAIAILGFVITPFLGLFSCSFSSIARAGHQSAAVNLCRDKMETVKSEGYDSVYASFVTAANNPLFETDLPTMPSYRRVTDVSPIEIISLPLLEEPTTLLLIAVTVYWTTNNQEYSETVESYLGKR
ncbi:MAG: type II secretion system protein [Dethiobacteria bacterium]|nr:type II secretion system protein [Dethiobacteria bacterium]